MTASTHSQPTVSTLFLAAVPVTHPAIRSTCKDPRDRTALHHAVMSLFPRDLPGPPDQRRHISNILFRLDTPPTGMPRLLVQATIPLARASELPTRDLTPLMAALTTGSHIRFWVVLNPVKAAGKDRRWKRTPIVNTLDDPDAITQFGLDQLARSGLTSITLTDLPRTDLVRAKTALWTAQYDGHALVADPDQLRGAIRAGIGRSKAYGCGLLSIAIV